MTSLQNGQPDVVPTFIGHATSLVGVPGPENGLMSGLTRTSSSADTNFPPD